MNAIRQQVKRQQIVNREYGMLSPISNKDEELNTKIVRKKREGRIRDNNEKKWPRSKGKQENMKYITNCFQTPNCKESQESSNCEAEFSNGPKNIIDAQTRRRTISETAFPSQRNSQSSTSMRDSVPLVLKNNRLQTHDEYLRKCQIEELKREIVKLKSINELIKKELNLAMRQKQNQNNSLKKYKINISDLEQSLRQSKQTIKIMNQELSRVKKELFYEKNEPITQNIKQAKSERIQKDSELQNLIEDIYKNFEDMGDDSKCQEEDFVKNSESEVRKNEMIHNLRENVKYLQLENRMLKKYKYEVSCLKKQINCYKKEVKRLEVDRERLNKKVRMSQEQLEKSREASKKIINEYSLSFELSKDETQ